MNNRWLNRAYLKEKTLYNTLLDIITVQHTLLSYLLFIQHNLTTEYLCKEQMAYAIKVIIIEQSEL